MSPPDDPTTQNLWPRGGVAYLFTDVVGSTTIAHELGDDDYDEFLRRPLFERLLKFVADHEGRQFQDKGDGIVGVFPGIDQALGCALDFQRSLNGNPITFQDKQIRVRMGIHVAPQDIPPGPDAEQPTYSTNGLNYASRVESGSDGGQILLSEVAYGRLSNSIRKGLMFHKWPNRRLKGLQWAHTLIDVLYDGRSAQEPPNVWVPEWYLGVLDSFVGRQDLLEKISGWLSTHPLGILTLKAFGGHGKTRLAVEALASYSHLIHGKVAFCALDGWTTLPRVSPLDEFCTLVAIGFGFSTEQMPNPKTELADAIQGTESVLFLDNWESVDDPEIARWVDALAVQAQVRVLVTSRSKWPVVQRSEEIEVPPLEQRPAKDLFLERAASRDPNFQVLESDEAAFSKIMEKLEGVPLAVELVAARAPEYRGRLGDLLAKLEQSFTEITKEGRRSVRSDAERQRSLEACLQWSIDLLPAEERDRFRSLAVLPPVFTHNAALAILGGDRSDWIANWIEVSLLRYMEDGRLRLVSSIREILRTQLEACPELRDEAWNRLIEYGCQLSDAREAKWPEEALLQLVADTLLSSPNSETLNLFNVASRLQDLATIEFTLNLDRAIQCYKQALLGCTREATPIQWAMTQNNLGNAYQTLPSGNREENLHESIHCYEQALLVYTRETAPMKWAMAHNNMGSAYQILPRGNREENLHKAIQCYEQALLIRTLEAAPPDWAMTQNNLGSAYQDLPSGNREENLQKAIQCYEQALLVFTREVSPFDWAMTQNNLGSAYQDLPSGNREENLEKAIQCYEKALLIRTREAAPFQWAMTLNNLGSAYQDLPSGNREENLDKAIQCYEKALSIRTLEVAPFDWAMTQNNLGNAYQDLPSGNREENLDKAIQCYEKALLVHTREAAPFQWAMTQNNLGSAYQTLRGENREENLQKAIQCYEKALSVYTHEAAPFQWAMIQNNLGNAYQDLPSGNREENLHKAILHYEQALLVRTRESAPFQWANTLYNLALTFYAFDDLIRAIATMRQSAEAYRICGVESEAQEADEIANRWEQES